MNNRTYTRQIISRTSVALLLSMLGAQASAWAHTVWVTPPPRTNGQSSGSALNYSGNSQTPCGNLTDYPVSATPTVYQAGSTVTMKFEETIIHHGNFQAYFYPATVTTQAGMFPNPLPSPVASPSPLFAEPQVSLNNGVVPYVHTIQVKIPNEPCEHCTLQMVQVNTDGVTGQPVYPAANAPGLVYYETCSDITITAGPVPSPSPSPSPSVTVTPTPTPTPTTVSCGTPTPTPIAATFNNVNSMILQNQCVSCHTGATGANGNTDLSNYAGVFGTVNLSNPTNSIIYQLTEEGSMPESGSPLTATQEDLLLRWIQAGAPNN